MTKFACASREPESDPFDQFADPAEEILLDVRPEFTSTAVVRLTEPGTAHG